MCGKLCVHGNQSRVEVKACPRAAMCLYFFSFLILRQNLAIPVQKNKLEMSLASSFTHNRIANTFQNLMVLEINPCSGSVFYYGGVEWLVILYIVKEESSFPLLQTDSGHG